MISYGVMPASRRGTRESSTSIPVPARAGISEAQQARPAPHLYGRAPFLRPLLEDRRGHGGAVDTVAPGLGSDIEDRVPHPLGPRAEDLIVPHQPDAHDVHEGVAAV